LQDTGLVSPGNRSGSITNVCGDPRSLTVYADLVLVGLPHTEPSRSLNCPLDVKIQVRI